MQREVAGLLRQGVPLRLVSLLDGAASFHGHPVDRFSWWRFWLVPFWLLYWLVRRPAAFLQTLDEWLAHPASSLQLFAETLLGFGYALCTARAFAAHPPRHLHAPWATAPATAALLLHRLLDLPFTLEAHAYDLFRQGGDPLLPVKVREAAWTRASTFQAAAALRALAPAPARVFCLRRGLPDPLPPLSTRPWPAFGPIHCLALGRCVPKKGFRALLRLAAAWRTSGLSFRLTLVGDGPELPVLRSLAASLGLAGWVDFPGFLPPAQLAPLWQRSDLFLYPGRIAADGDRDGFPNVIAEAMAWGLPVLSTPLPGVVEVIRPGHHGFLVPLDDPAAWLPPIRALAADPGLLASIRAHARAWVENEFSASRHSALLAQALLSLSPPLTHPPA